MAFNGWTDFAAQRISNRVLAGQGSASPGATLYLGGFTVAPSNVAGSGTQSLLVARAAVAANPTNFPPATGSGTVSIKNGTPIIYPTAAAGTQETWVAIGVWDALSAGNLWGAWAIPVAQQPIINAGTIYQHAIGELIFQLISGANGGWTDFAMIQILNRVFAQTALPTIANWFLGAFFRNPTSAGGQGESQNPAYTRVSIPASLAGWTAPSGAVNVIQANLNAENFPVLAGTGTSNWSGWGLFDALTAGNLWLWGANAGIIPVGPGSLVTYPANSLQSILTCSL